MNNNENLIKSAVELYKDKKFDELKTLFNENNEEEFNNFKFIVLMNSLKSFDPISENKESDNFIFNDLSSFIINSDIDIYKKIEIENEYNVLVETSIISFAITSRNIEILKLLMSKGFTVKDICEDKLCPISFILKEYTKDDEKINDIIFYLIDNGFDINEKIIEFNKKDNNFNNLSLIYYASLKGNSKLFNYLVENNVDINKTYSGVSLLFLSLCAKNDEISTYLIDNVKELLPDNHPTSIINIPISLGNVEITKKMLDKGYPFEKEPLFVENPVILAINKSEEFANMILESNFKFKMTPINGITVIESFCFIKSISFELFKKIIDKITIDIENVNYPVLKTTPALHMLIANREYDKLEYLLSKGLDTEIKVAINDNYGILNQVNISGMTPLMFASYAGFYKAIKILIKYNADPNTEDLLGNKAITVSKNANKETFIALLSSDKILLDQNVDDDEKVYVNPIHLLSQINDEAAVNLMRDLIKREPVLLNKPIENKHGVDGFTPLMLACSVVNIKMIEELLNYNDVDINYYNKVGERALSELLMSNNNSVIANMVSNMETMQELEDIQNGKINLNDESELNELIEDKIKLANLMIEKGAEINFKINKEKFVNLLKGKEQNFLKSIKNKKEGFFSKIFG